MLDKYRTNIDSLDQESAALVASALSRRHGTPVSPDSLFDSCVALGVDQADVVLAVAHDPSPLAVRALETVVGKPIEYGRPALLQRHAPRYKSESVPQRAEPKSKLTRAPVQRTDPRKIVYVAPNPKKPGSASYDRFSRYVAGMTVTEAIAAGVTAADVKWDSERGFIKFEGDE